MHSCECEVDNWLCTDCGVDTQEIGEYYMVTDSCWKKAGDVDGMLCVGCIEKRLGRRLTARNFTSCPLNWSNAIVPYHCSERLCSRMHSSAKGKWATISRIVVDKALFQDEPELFESLTLLPVEVLRESLYL
jgi:hypothetical protein